MERLIAHSEAAIRRGLSALREGRFVAEDVIEGPDGPLTIRVVLTIEGGELWADFSGTSPQVDAPLNCRPPTLSA
jgi:N-methylhydantoinase B